MVIKWIFTFLLMLIINSSSAFAYTPAISVQVIDENDIYKPEIVQKLTEELIAKLRRDNRFNVINKNESDYFIEGNIVSLGNGNALNDEIGISIGNSGSSVHGGFGIFHRQNDIFTIAIRTKVIRVNDNKIVYKGSFIDRERLIKGKITEGIIENAVEKITESIAKKLIKDVVKEKPKIFVEPR